MSPSDEREEARLARKRQRRSRRRQAILDAALELLIEAGASGLTMAEVARRVDLTKPALYYYFKTKEALVAELALALIDEEVEAVLSALDAVEGGVASVIEMVRVRAHLYATAPHRFNILWNVVLLLGPTSATSLESIYAGSWRLHGVLEERLLADQEAGLLHDELHPRRFINVAFLGVQGILHVTHSMALVGGDLRFSIDELVEELTRTLERSARP